MPKASELKKGMVIEIKGVPHIVKHLESKSPSSRGAVTLYKIEFRNLQNGSKVDLSLKGGDLLPLADFIRIPVQYSYSDSDYLYFMNSDTFEQFEIARDQLSEQLPFLSEQQENISALVSGERILAIELPQSVDLRVEDTPPAVSGSSATNRTKTAKLSTNLKIQVPEYLKPGDFVRVNTVTGKFMSRV